MSPPLPLSHPGVGDSAYSSFSTNMCLHNSRQAIKKYVQANNNLSGVTDATFTTQFNKALQKGSETGVFARPKGTIILTIDTTHTCPHDLTNTLA
jgi:histone H1/5